MIDGKICNALTSTSFALRCYVCRATPKEMNSLVTTKEKEVTFKSFSFGLSTLHMWIRFFKCLVHISYRIDIKKWQVRAEDQASITRRKALIQEKIKWQMGLLVGIPKPRGSGATNDGNMTRRFFSDPALYADMTGLEETLIHHFAIILQTFSCGFAVNAAAFDDYAMDTARLFVRLYGWYYMPASIHKNSSSWIWDYFSSFAAYRAALWGGTRSSEQRSEDI